MLDQYLVLEAAEDLRRAGIRGGDAGRKRDDVAAARESQKILEEVRLKSGGRFRKKP